MILDFFFLAKLITSRGPLFNTRFNISFGRPYGHLVLLTRAFSRLLYITLGLVLLG